MRWIIYTSTNPNLEKMLIYFSRYVWLSKYYNISRLGKGSTVGMYDAIYGWAITMGM